MSLIFRHGVIVNWIKRYNNTIYSLTEYRVNHTFNLGCVSLGNSDNGLRIQNHLDHGASKEPMSPLWESIPRFLVLWSWINETFSDFPQKRIFSTPSSFRKYLKRHKWDLHCLQPFDLVAQSVIQRWSNLKVAGSIAHPGHSFSLSLCGHSITRANA